MHSNNQLDFLSDEFDASAVLESDVNKIKIPIPDAKTFNNLDEYALKSFPSKKTDDKNKNQTDLDLLRKQRDIRERMKEKIELLDSKKSDKRQKTRSEPNTVLTLMYKKSDNQLDLINYLNKRIRIFIRRRRKSRYPCEQFACIFGQLLFYDRHWNLILSDVNETIQFIDGEKLDDQLGNKSDEKSNKEINNKIEFINKQKLNELNKKNSFNSNNSINDSDDQLSLSSCNLISSIDNRRLLIKKDDKSLFKISIRERYFTRLFVRGDNIIYISKL